MTERWYTDGKETVRVRLEQHNGRPRWNMLYSNGDRAHLDPATARILLERSRPCDPVPGLLE